MGDAKIVILSSLILSFLLSGCARRKVAIVPDTEVLVAVPSQYPVTFGWNDEHSTEDALNKLGVDGYYTYQREPLLYDGYSVYAMIWSPSGVGKPLGGTEQEVLLFNECSVSGQADCTAMEAVGKAYEAIQLYTDRTFTTPCDFDLGWQTDFHDEYVAIYGDFPFVALCLHAYSQNKTLESAVAAVAGHVDKAIALADQWGVYDIWLMETAWVPWHGPDDANKGLFLHMLRKEIERRPQVTRMAAFCMTASEYEPWSFGPWTTTLIGWGTGKITVDGRWYTGDLSRVYLPLVVRP